MESNYCLDGLSSRNQYVDLGVSMELSKLWHCASLKFQVDDTDGAREPSRVVETPERETTLKHLVGGALCSDSEVFSRSSPVQKLFWDASSLRLSMRKSINRFSIVSVIIQNACEDSLLPYNLFDNSEFVCGSVVFPIRIFHVILSVCDWSFFCLISLSMLSILTTGIRARFVMADEKKIRVERFNDANFGFWKMQ